MKKFFVSLFLGFTLFLPLHVSAIDLGGKLVNNAAVQAGYDKNTNEQSFAELIGTVIKGLLSFIGVIFLVLMVYAGYLWMTAQGDESQIEKSQNIIKSSIIGMVILVGAYTITAFVVPAIVEKTTGDTQQGGTLGGGNDALCCVVCPAHGAGDCAKSVVGSESECMQKLGCSDNSSNNVDNSCSVTSAPADQCTGALARINCCTIVSNGNSTKQIVADEATCQYRFDTICQDNQSCANANNNVDFSYDYESNVSAESCR